MNKVPLTREETLELIRRSKEGDKNAREYVVQENTGLVWSIVRRFVGRGCEIEDLFQIGSIGLMKAIDKFDENFEVQFSTYAVPMISGEIKRFLRDNGMIRVSRSIKELAVKIRAAEDQFCKKNGREPTMSELAEQVGVPTEEIAVALEAGAEVESIYKTIYEGDGNAIQLIDRLEQEKRPDEELVNYMTLETILRDLPKREKDLIFYRYYEEKTQTKVAEMMGISQVQVSRMEKKILIKMRDEFYGKVK